MDVNIQLHKPPFSDSFISDFIHIAKLVFGNANQDSLRWRLEEMPDVTVFVATVDDRLVGFKAGYAATDKRYYSWLGGVDSDFRKQGIAKQLMSHQHKWLLQSGYQLLETHVLQNNKAMVLLNHNSGLAITGHFMKDGKPNYVMQKRIIR